MRGAWVHSKRARPDRREDVRWVVVLRLRGRGRWHGSRTFARKDLADEFAAHLRAELAADYAEEHTSAAMAAAAGVVDEVIEPAATRGRLIAALEALGTRRRQR